MYSFTRFFEWPENKKVGEFVIYVVGKNDNLIGELKTLAGKKKVGNQDIEIKNTPVFDPTINAQMVYLTPEISRNAADVISKNKNKGTLIISDGTGGCKQWTCTRDGTIAKLRGCKVKEWQRVCAHMRVWSM
jgi:hypothetical protein